MANSDVKLRHKVQLRKKVEEPKVAVETVETGKTPTPDKFGSKTWLWILLGVIGVFIIGYFIFSKSKNTDVIEPEQGTEIVEEIVVPTDSVANQEDAAGEVVPTDDNELSYDADHQETKVNEVPVTTDNNLNLATITKSTANNSKVSNDIEVEAMKVIRGDYGVGQERKDKLGTKYQTVQSRVNELKREGVF